MIAADPLIIGKERFRGAIPYSLLQRQRFKRSLFVGWRTIYLWTPDGWIRIPRTYVTDFGSIPSVATWLTLNGLRPTDPACALAFLGHDFPYAVGEPGRRDRADDWLKCRLEIQGADKFDRMVIVEAVRRFGKGGYRKAPSWWDSENFADPDTGEYPIKAPFAREAAFDGGPWGLRPDPDWIEPA